MLLEVGVQPIEMLVIWQLYMQYVTKAKNILDHILPKQVCNVGCKVKKKIRAKSPHLFGCVTLWNGSRDGEIEGMLGK